VRTKFVSKSSILYENGGPVTLCVNEVVIVAIEGIIPLFEVEVVKTIMVRTDEGELGGGTPAVVAAVEGV
jgi:hypothetical protein